MSSRNLNYILQPTRVAVVGASDVPGKVGHILLHNLVGHGFEGVVYPVNSQREAVQGIVAYPRLSALPHAPDLAVLCTPAATIPELVEECGRLGIPGVVIISAGFREAGDAGRELETQIECVRLRYPGLRIIGPNCLGVMTPARRFNASFAASMPAAGRVAFLSQSGALCTSILDWANATGFGFSHFVSVGNMLDVTLGDLLDYLAADDQTDAVVLYVESITDARQFMSAARACARNKPIVAYKAGRFGESAKAAASHTGALAGVDAVYDAAFRRAGIVRVFDVDEMFDCAELLARSPRRTNWRRLAIVTNAGGPGVMACDALLERRGSLATLTPETIQRLDQRLPAYWSHGNPVDILGDAGADRYGAALDAVLADPGVDAVLTLLTPQAMTDPDASAAAVAETARRHDKAVLAAWMGGAAVETGVARLNAAGVPTFRTPEHAVRAFMRLVEYQSNREILFETPRDVPIQFALDRKALRQKFESLRETAPEILSEVDSKSLLGMYGIAVTEPQAAHTADEAVHAARATGYPVALKILSPQITHKTEVAGVEVNLLDDQQVVESFNRIVASGRRLRPDAQILGVSVQRMLVAPHSVELLLGMKRDPVFGPVIVLGCGGVTAEVMQDRALELPPLNERLAQKMLESLRIWPLLQGFRGRPRVALDKVIETLMRFSYLIAHVPEIREIDVNPLLATPTEVVALDARVFVERGVRGASTSPLAISAYPEEWTEDVILSDGARLRLRALQPEDEPAWKAFVEATSLEARWRRFEYLFKEATHEMAVRFCCVDYDREMPVAAETLEDPKRIVGIARSVVGPNRQGADFALLVADDFQRRGLGRLLAEKSIALCQRQGLCEMTAETTVDNEPMLRILRRSGYKLEYLPNSKSVLGRLVLQATPVDR